MEAVLVKFLAGDVSLTAFSQDLRQLARARQVFEARAPARDELATDEDGGHHPVPRHGLHDVHHHLPVAALLVHLHALKLSAQVVKRPL